MNVNHSQSQHVGTKDGASINKEDRRHRLLMCETLERPLTLECCIYRIPECIRKVNEAAYTPRVVLIGPFHHGAKQVKIMDKYKQRYLSDFHQRTKVTLEVLVTSIRQCEERVRCCYAENINLSSDDFVDMILLDGGFIIECILRACGNGVADVNHEVLHKPWLDRDLRKDLILLENQLPFFVLEKLYSLTISITDHSNGQSISFITMACRYFKIFNRQNLSPQSLEEVKHFTDLVRKFYLPSSPRSPPKGDITKQISYSAVELHEAGVKFKVGLSKCLFDIKFTNGMLEIPHLVVKDQTESHIRNIMALEQCQYPNETYICDYIILMDTLINTAKDVELLKMRLFITP